MTDEVRLSTLVLRWHELLRQGEKPDVNDICRDHPELADELRRRVEFPTLASNRAETVSSMVNNDGPDEPILAPPQDGGEIGRLGGFRLVRIIGKGGMGVVYEGEDINLGRRVAVKVLRPGLVDEQFRIRFDREARAVASLKDNHVVTIFQVGREGETPFMVMEYLEGESLEERLRRNSTLDLAEAVRIAREVAEGLAAAHAKELVHRDVKPGNIWLERPNGWVKLLDFGLVRPQSNADQQLTAHGAIAGTIGYMAPEQIYGGQLDARTDLYALGCVLHRMIWGSLPHDAAETMLLLRQVVTTDPVKLKAAANKLPAPLASLLRGLLARNPDERPATAKEVATELGEIQRSLGAPVKTASASAPVGSSVYRQPGQKRSLLGVWIGAATVLLACIIGIATQYNRIFQRSPASNAAVPGDPTSGPPAAPELAGEPIRIGVLHAMSGAFKDSERPMYEAIVLAVEEINAKGGLLGRKIEPILRDTRSDDVQYARFAEELIVKEKVTAIFGCWSSSSRKAVAEVCARHKQLLIYSCLNEGLEEDPNVVYVGGAPNQQLQAAVNWALTYQELRKRRFFLVGSDAIYSRCAHAILKEELGALDIKPVGDEYARPGSSDFKSILAKIKESNADVIINTLEDGASNIAFAQAFRTAGLTPENVPTIWLGVGEDELGAIDPSKLVGDWAVMPYFQSIPTPENQAFVKRFRSRFPARTRISDWPEASYCAVHLWKQAVEQVNTLEPLTVRDGFRGQSFDGPEGRITIDKDNLYAWRRARLARMTHVDDAYIFKVKTGTEDAIKPEPFPPPRTRKEWEDFLQGIYKSWGGRWRPPAQENKK